ncbi:MAG: hypothetical protein ACI8S6_005240, partial [Myxococcota bacterium]
MSRSRSNRASGLVGEKGAGGVAEDAGTVGHWGGLRGPASVYAVGEQCRCVGGVAPHGDRRDGAESRGIVDDGASVGEGDDDVVGKLVLG